MAWIPAAVGAAGSIAGGVLGGDGQEQFGPGDAIPKHLKDAWRTAGGQISELSTPEYYQGQLVADQNPYWQNSLTGMNQFGQNDQYGGAAANFMGLQGANAMNQGMGGQMNYLNQMQQSGPRQFQYDQNTFDQSMQNLMPGLQGSYDAMMRDPVRQFEEQTLPGINMGSIGGGNQFGTKSFNQGAIANRGLQDRAADTAAGLWSNAANQAQSAAYGAGGLNMQSGQNMDNNMLNAYGNMAGQGGQWLNQGYNMAANNLGMQNQAGMQQQPYDQSLIQAQMDRHNFNQQSPWTALNNRLGMMGQQSIMPTQSGVNTGFSNAVNGGTAALGLYNAYQNGQTPNTVYGQSDPGWSVPFDQGSAWDGSF